MCVFTLVFVLPLLFFGTTADNLAFVSALGSKAIYKASLPTDSFNGSFTFIKVTNTTFAPKQVGYDPVDGKIYWCQLKHIVRCDLDGSNSERYKGNKQMWGLALDVTNRTIYFSDGLTGGVSSLAIGDFGTINSHNLIAGTVIAGNLKPREIAYGAKTNSLYVTHGSTTIEINKYNVDGTGKTTLFSTGQGDTIVQPLGIFVDEDTEELFFSDKNGDKGQLWSYNLQDSIKTNIYDGSDDRPRGLDIYGCTLYYCDQKHATLFKISKYGLTERTEVQYTLDEGTLEGCIDIHFYIENSADRYQELPRINFEVDDIGPFCEGDSTNVTLTNVGNCRYNVSVGIINGTAVEGEDVEMVTETVNNINILPTEHVTYEVKILADAICEYTEDNFVVALYDDNDALISDTINSTVNLTITPDPQCEISPINFYDLSIGPVCEGSSISTTFSNSGICNHTVSVDSINETALGEVDFETKTDIRFTIAPAENVTYEIAILKDEDFETSKESFQLQLIQHHNDLVINTDSKVNVLISSDNGCNIKIVNIVRAYFGGFHGKVVFTIDYDVSDWYVKLMFVRGVWKLEILDCEAEVRHVLRQPGSHRTFYTLGPTYESRTLRKGGKLRIEFIATTSKKLRGMPTRALFLPL